VSAPTRVPRLEPKLNGRSCHEVCVVSSTVFLHALTGRLDRCPFGRLFGTVTCRVDDVDCRSRKSVPRTQRGWIRPPAMGRFRSRALSFGLQQYLRQAFAVKRTGLPCSQCHDAVILRVPSQLARFLPPCWAERHPFAGGSDRRSYAFFAPGAVRHPLRPFLRHWFAARASQTCRRAFAAAYRDGPSALGALSPHDAAMSVHYRTYVWTSGWSKKRTSDPIQNILEIVTVAFPGPMSRPTDCKLPVALSAGSGSTPI